MAEMTGDFSLDADNLLNSAVKILSRDIPTPKYSSVDLKPVKKEVAKASATRDEANTTIQQATALEAEAVKQQKVGYTEQAAADSEQATAVAARDAVSASKYDAFNTLLTTQQQIADSIAESSKFIINAKPGADAKLAVVQEMQSVGFLDNPLEWAYNQIQLPAKIKDYNKDAQRINSAQDAIDAGLKNVKDVGDGAVKSVPNTTAAMAAATGKAAAAKAVILSAQADENMARINVEFAGRKLAGDLAIASQTEAMSRLQLQENQNRFQAQIAAINAADSQANRLMKAAELTIKFGENQQLREVVLANYDRMTGREPGTTTLVAYNKMPPNIRSQVEAIGASSSYGQPYDALISLRTLKTGDKLPETTKNLMKFLSDKEVQHEKELAGAIKDGNIPKAEEAGYRQRALNQMLLNDLNNELVNPDASKLFRAPTPQELIASGAIKADSTLGQLLEPLTKTTTPISAETIATQIFKNIKNPTQGGAMLAEYYNASRVLSIGASNVGAINGVKVPPGYVVQGRAGAFSKPVPFDLTKPAEATRYMLLNSVFGGNSKEDVDALNARMRGENN